MTHHDGGIDVNSVQPKSLKCEEYVVKDFFFFPGCLTSSLCSCGKLLKSELDIQVDPHYVAYIDLCTFLMQAHAARTGHQNFVESTEEIKPLSAEEKAAQLAKY